MAPTPAPWLSARPIVLVADNDEEALAVLAMGLSMLGFDVMAAHSGDEARRRGADTRPDVIVTAIAPPSAVGWQFLDDVSADASLKGVPVAVLSSRLAASDRARAVRTGCRAFFVQPCQADELALGLFELIDSTRADSRPS